MKEYSQELLDMLQPGKAVRIFYNESNVNNQIRHIRAIVDDEYIAYRVWSKRKEDWLYRIAWIYEFYLRFKGRELSIAQEDEIE